MSATTLNAPFDRQGTASDEERLQAAMRSFVGEFGVTAALHLESCVHCGLCASACHFYVTTGEPKYTPIHKLEPFRRAYLREASPLAPLIRKLCKETGCSIDRIYELFPSGPAKGACKIAGLPKPTGCV